MKVQACYRPQLRLVVGNPKAFDVSVGDFVRHVFEFKPCQQTSPPKKVSFAIIESSCAHQHCLLKALKVVGS